MKGTLDTIMDDVHNVISFNTETFHALLVALLAFNKAKDEMRCQLFK